MIVSTSCISMWFHAPNSKKNLERFLLKAQIKLANKLTPATAGTTCGTFTPLLLAFKVTSDKLSGIHNQWSLKLNDLLREVLKYNDEQQKKHKQVRNLKNNNLGKIGCSNLRFKWWIHYVYELHRRKHVKMSVQLYRNSFTRFF